MLVTTGPEAVKIKSAIILHQAFIESHLQYVITLCSSISGYDD